MQFSLVTILALAATALAAPAAEAESQVSPQVIGQQCRITGLTIPGNPARPANIDGTCQSTQTCGSVGGSALGNCPGGGSCCFKFDCAGRNSNSACLFPKLAGDSPPGAGQFVNGACPPGLRCFRLL